MEEKLTDRDMNQLEQWIGTGPKIFTLLYKISRDGCEPGIFHQKCDRRGPTITVLYNQHGSVYGAYTSVSWESSARYVTDSSAFLYQLRYNGSDKMNKFQVQRPDEAVIHDVNYGPIFGSGHDLRTFNGTRINQAGNIFILDGSMKRFGATYNTNGVTADQVNNGTMEVTDLEVYLVADGQRVKAEPKMTSPWRKTKVWNEKLHNELKEEIVNFKPIQDLHISEAKILMIGPVGAGKSSFFNTIDSIYRGRITDRAGSGSAEHSLTSAFIPYSVAVSSGATLNFRLCDTRGLEESMGIDVLECNFLLDGNIPFYYEFNPTRPISTESHGFKPSPTRNDKIHCAVFVVDSTTLEALSTKIIEKMKGLRGLMNQKGIPQIILLTKIDKLCDVVQKDVSRVFYSPTVEKAVEKASQLLGLPRANVLPVKNYENEAELDDDIDILALLALRKMLYCSEDFMLNMKQKEWDVKAEMEKLRLEK